jgi:hypothetical protein
VIDAVTYACRAQSLHAYPVTQFRTRRFSSLSVTVIIIIPCHDLPRSGTFSITPRKSKDACGLCSFRNCSTQDLRPEEAALRPLDDLLVD